MSELLKFTRRWPGGSEELGERFLHYAFRGLPKACVGRSLDEEELRAWTLSTLARIWMRGGSLPTTEKRRKHRMSGSPGVFRGS